MRYYNNGSGFTVGYSRADAEQFSRRWPCSTVRGSGSFAFDAGGNLVDATGSALKGDGGDWLAFCEDCQQYGERKRAK